RRLQSIEIPMPVWTRPQTIASFRVIERLFAPSPACGGGLGRGPLGAFVPWNCPFPDPPPQAGEGIKTEPIVGRQRLSFLFVYVRASGVGRRLAPALAVLLGFAGLICEPAPAAAQARATLRPASPAVVPGFWDPRRRPERPDTARMNAIRFMTEVDYPPFN